MGKAPSRKMLWVFSRLRRPLAIGWPRTHPRSLEQSSVEYYFFIAFVVIIVVVFLAICGYNLARFIKGKVVIELSRASANPEELISGKVTVIAKKQINGLLKVSLVGQEKRSEGSGDDKIYEWVDVYRYDQVLEQKRVFEAGTEQIYSFDLLAPGSDEVNSAGTKLKGWVESPSSGLVGKLKTKVSAKMDEHAESGKNLDHLSWHVEALLDADGVDLSAKEDCTVAFKW